MNPAILGRVQRIVADIFAVPVEGITLDTSPETIETWDSLQHLNLMLAIEQEFGFQIAPGEMDRFLSVRQIVSFMSKKMQTAAGS